MVSCRSRLTACRAAAGVLMALPAVATAGPARLDLALGSDIRGTAPGIVRDENTDVVMMHVFEGLVGLTENGGVGPLLARSIDPSPDGRIYHFRLRAGLRFSNGAPVSPAAVVRTWQWYLNPHTNWLCLQGFDGTAGAKLLSVKAVGTDGVDFTLDRPDPQFLSRMDGP